MGDAQTRRRRTRGHWGRGRAAPQASYVPGAGPRHGMHAMPVACVWLVPDGGWYVRGVWTGSKISPSNGVRIDRCEVGKCPAPHATRKSPDGRSIESIHGVPAARLVGSLGSIGQARSSIWGPRRRDFPRRVRPEAHFRSSLQKQGKRYPTAPEPFLGALRIDPPNALDRPNKRPRAPIPRALQATAPSPFPRRPPAAMILGPRSERRKTRRRSASVGAKRRTAALI